MCLRQYWTCDPSFNIPELSFKDLHRFPNVHGWHLGSLTVQGENDIYHGMMSHQSQLLCFKDMHCFPNVHVWYKKTLTVLTTGRLVHTVDLNFIQNTEDIFGEGQKWPHN